MFTLKLFNSSIKCSRLNQRHISVGSGALLRLFKDETKAEALPFELTDEVEEIDPELEQKRIDKIRNKSGLLPQHRNMLMGTVPYQSAESWIHNTLKYKRKIYAKHGSASGIDPRICFWSQTELDEKKEYERVAFPKTIPEMIAINEQQKREKAEVIQAREELIGKNLKKLKQWTKDIKDRKEKKEEVARVAKERKDRLIDEVRRHFGYTVDPRDDRFKEMLEMKEKEQKKALKESKRKGKEEKLMAKLMEGKESEKKEGQESDKKEGQEDKEASEEKVDEDDKKKK